MKLKLIIQSEVSQKEKHQYSILTHIWLGFIEVDKMGGSWWRGLTERGPLEKGMASHLSILAWRTP